MNKQHGIPFRYLGLPARIRSACKLSIVPCDNDSGPSSTVASPHLVNACRYPKARGCGVKWSRGMTFRHNRGYAANVDIAVEKHQAPARKQQMPGDYTTQSPRGRYHCTESPEWQIEEWSISATGSLLCRSQVIELVVFPCLVHLGLCQYIHHPSQNKYGHHERKY